MIYSEAIDFINKIPQFIEGYGIDRGKQLLDKLNHPERTFMIIHVAGTNGKGSVSAYLEGILRNAGYKTGLFTSPHLVDERERIRINGELIDRDFFEKEFEEVRSCNLNMAYFDYFFGIAMCAFRDENVDICVMETGLGGELDITNAVDNPIGCVITSISLDHTAILGSTISQIAGQKAGIIKQGVPVVYDAVSEEVSSVINEKAKEMRSQCIGVDRSHFIINKTNVNCIDFLINNEYYKNDMFTVSTRALYQVDNATLALSFISVMEECGKLNVSMESKRKGLISTCWPGRMENVSEKIFIDGAHNPDGIKEFLASARNIAGKEKSVLLFSAVKDKNFKTMIRQICESGLFSEYVVVRLHTQRGLQAEEIRDTFAEFTESKVDIYDNVDDAFKNAENTDGKYLFCAGSLYLVGEIKQLLQKRRL